MSMDEARYNALIQELGEEARRHPARYRARIALLALLGYAYILFFLLALLACLLVVYLWAFAVPLLILVLRALWVRLETPTGISVQPDQAPRLFQLLRKTSAAFHRPNFHVVLVTDQMNAGVTQTPRVGVFGWHKNYLCLGMPLLLALSPAELEAILAHEFAHLFGAHSRFAAWIVRIRHTWERLISFLDTRKPRGAFLFRKFFEWYSPLFAAHAFAFERANEIEADGFAADWAGPEPAATSLIKLRLYDSFWKNVVWPELRRLADSASEPGFSLYRSIQSHFQQMIPDELAREYLRLALLEQTTIHDPHPSLADRLKFLHQEPRVPPVASASAAEHFLGAALPHFFDCLDQRWREYVSADWKKRFETCEAHRKRMQELDEISKQRALAPEESLEYAERCEDLRSSEDALPLYEAILKESPDYAPAQYAVGRILLAKEPDSGVALLEKAMSRDERYALYACELIRNSLLSAGREDEAKSYHQRYLNHFRKLDAIRRERGVANSNDRYWPADLTAEEIAAIAVQLLRYPQIARAYFVRKHIPSDPNTPFFLLCVEWRTLWPMLNSQNLVLRLAHEVKIPREDWAVVSIYGNRLLARAIKRVYGGLIYRRPIGYRLRKLLRLTRRPAPAN